MICCYQWYSPVLFISNNKGVLMEGSPVIHICIKIQEHKGFCKCTCGELTLTQERIDSDIKNV